MIKKITNKFIVGVMLITAVIGSSFLTVTVALNDIVVDSKNGAICSKIFMPKNITIIEALSSKKAKSLLYIGVPENERKSIREFKQSYSICQKYGDFVQFIYSFFGKDNAKHFIEGYEIWLRRWKQERLPPSYERSCRD